MGRSFGREGGGQVASKLGTAIRFLCVEKVVSIAGSIQKTKASCVQVCLPVDVLLKCHFSAEGCYCQPLPGHRHKPWCQWT